jgi:DNA-binding transcriptional MerR regulator
MRIAELSRRTGIPVPTIKYYLREGLLRRGERTGPNQAEYDEGHERRLRLARALVDVGGLSIAATKELLAHVDTPGPDVNQLLGRTMSSVLAPRTQVDPDELRDARATVDELVARRGWLVDHDYPARDNLAEVIAVLRRFGGDRMLAHVDRYADAAELIASADLDTVEGLPGVDAILEAAVLGTILGDRLIALLRRLAQASESTRRYGAGDRSD